MPESARVLTLEAEVQKFRVECERYFNGAVAVPPEELAQDIRETIREIYGVGELDTPERFRLSGIVARFNALDERFNRRLREQATGPPRASAPPAVAQPRPASGLVLDDGSPVEASQALFRQLYGDASAARAEAFHHYLRQRAAEIRATTGCTQVRFEVRTEEGRRKLVARPVGSSS